MNIIYLILKFLQKSKYVQFCLKILRNLLSKIIVTDLLIEFIDILLLNIFLFKKKKRFYIKKIINFMKIEFILTNAKPSIN